MSGNLLNAPRIFTFKRFPVADTLKYPHSIIFSPLVNLYIVISKVKIREEPHIRHTSFNKFNLFFFFLNIFGLKMYEFSIYC